MFYLCFQHLTSQLARWASSPAKLHTVDRERFAGLNIHSFSAIKVFTEILSHCLGHKCSLFSTIKEWRLYSQKNFCVTPENREKCKSLAQRIFPHLPQAALYYNFLNHPQCWNSDITFMPWVGTMYSRQSGNTYTFVYHCCCLVK